MALTGSGNTDNNDTINKEDEIAQIFAINSLFVSTLTPVVHSWVYFQLLLGTMQVMDCRYLHNNNSTLVLRAQSTQNGPSFHSHPPLNNVSYSSFVVNSAQLIILCGKLDTSSSLNYYYKFLKSVFFVRNK